MTRRIVAPLVRRSLFALLILAATGGSLSAQRQGRFLAKEDIILLGLGLRVEPAHHTVPRDVATIVSTYLKTSNDGTTNAPPFAPDAVVKGTLRGPGLQAPLELQAAPNSPFNIPPLSVAGMHTLDNIRLESGGQVLMYGAPESVTIEVLDKLLVTQITSRPLTAAEIRERGIVFDKSNFQAYNFTAAFAVRDQPINIDFPVVLPRLADVIGVSTDTVTIGRVDPPSLPSLKTIIPDTLRIQTQVPNLAVVGFSLMLELPQGQELLSFPIPGVIVVPGNIGFLNQNFSVMLMVGNVAPPGSNLVVTDLKAAIVLPAGNDTVAGSPDDPLVMVRTAAGESPRVQPIVQAGPDGQIGTGDDVMSLAPGESGTAEYLVEGRREGTHVIEMEMSGTLNGLPVGPVPIRGRAAGSVLVRNPRFTLTFTHPEIVTAGEAYTLDVTVTNTSQSPANFVSLNLYPHQISGATLTGQNTREIESIPPGDSATVSFDLVSRTTGKVTAATLDSDDNVSGRFALKTSVGELGVPLSPDSLILPKEARSLPRALLDASVGLLGKAWAVATAPAGALPASVSRFSKQIVFDRAVEVAEAGFRVSLHEPVGDSVAQLATDFLGSNFPRLAELTSAGNLPFVEEDYRAFDALRRTSVRGDIFAQAVADVLRPDLSTRGVTAFHRQLATALSYRPGHIAVLVGAHAGPLPVRVSIVDSQGRRVGGTAGSKIVKEIPFSDLLTFRDGTGPATAELAIVAAPAAGPFIIRIEPAAGVPPDAFFTMSVVVPDASGDLRQVTYENVTSRSRPSFPNAAGALHTIAFDVPPENTTPAAPADNGLIPDPPPRIVGVVQQPFADVVTCDGAAYYPGRIIAVLFSEEVTPASVQDRLASSEITKYAVDGNAVVGVALQPGRRIAFLALRDGIGPFIQRALTVNGIQDRRGQSLPPQTLPIEATVTQPGGVVSGQLIEADGTPVSGNVRLFYYLHGGCAVGISSKNTSPQGHFSWDYVLKDIAAAEIIGVNPEKDTFRRVRFSIQRDGQRLNVNIVLLGRGTLQGRTLNEAGAPLAGTKVKVTSLTDQSQYGTTSDEQGRFTIPNVPVGNVFVEAVNITAKAQTNLSEHIPLAGGITTRDIVLLNVDTTRIIVKTGTLTGHVLRSDGSTPVADAPVTVYYRHFSQPGVGCPPLPSEAAKRFNHCPIAVSRTDQAGAFTFTEVTAGSLIVEAFDQATLQEGEGGLVLAADGTASVNVLLGAGLGVVKGVVLDATRQPVAGARVGGGLSLTTTAADGTFTLPDVPVGRREIVAVSDQLGSRGTALVDIVRAGEQVSATIILDALASVAGTIYQPNGTTPVPNLKVYLFKGCDQGAGICVVGTATTNATGGYRIDGIPLGRYKLSAFNTTLTAGNVVPVETKYSGQVARADVTFRGGGGQVSGRVLDDDGQTPLKARVAISGDRIVSAGGIVGTGFTYVRNYQIADTDLSGQFSFNGLFVGEFALSAVGEFSPDPVTLAGAITQPGQAVQMDLRLQPTSRIAGTVVLPPSGAEHAGPNVIVKFKSDAVKIVCTAGSNGPRCTAIPQGIQEEVVITDSEGRYLLPVVNAGPFTLTAEDPATGRTARVHGTIRAGEIAEIPIRLLAFSELTVEVLGSNATTPIPGARVEVTQLEYPKKKLTFFADAQGRIVFSGADRFTEGELVVLATDVRNGFAGRASVRLEKDGAPVTAKVYLYDESGTVKGTVTRADGTPAAFADVVISNCLPDGFGGCNTGGTLAFAVTDASGYYEQAQIPAGAFSVEVFDATTGRHGFATGQMGGVNGSSVTVNVVEAALGLVKGAVLMGGTLAPLKGATLSLSQRGLSGRVLPSLYGTSSVDGSFAFPGTTLGTFTIEARAAKPEPGGFTSVSAAISSEGQVVDLPIVVNILRPVFGTIAGTVYNAVGGTPAANSRVEICHPGIDCGQLLILTTGPDGRFALPAVPLGRFTVTVRSQNALNSASLIGELEFEDQVTDLVLTLTGLRKISGTVVFHGAGEQVAPNVEVSLSGTPSSGCNGGCIGFADANGNFSFNDVPADVFTVSARDPITGLRGAVGGSLAAAEHKIVRIVLQPSGRVSGRVLTSANMPAPGVTAELTLLPGNQGSGTLFTESAANGEFVFTSVPIGPFRLQLQDPLGSGIGLRQGTVTGDMILGDITLDEAAPAVTATTPSAAAVGVAQNQVIQIVFSEPIDQGTINPENVVLSDPEGAVVAVLSVTAGDTTLSIAPVAPLKTETRYALKIRGVKDRLGKTMADFVLNFTTIDITPPAPIDLSPAPGTSGVSIDTTFRVKFSEPIDPAKLGAPPVTITSAAGAVVEGQFALLFGNTVAVFTPARPLARGTAYRVQMGAVTDLSGNVQAAALDYTFATTDGTAPEISSLTAANNGVVVENGIATVVANVGATHDIAVVDFYANGTLVASDRSLPYELRLQVTEAVGTPGTQVTIGALATDTSGNRGRTPAQALLTVVADQPPTVAIATPSAGTSARNGDLIHVSVQSADDLGVASVGFRAQTGKPQDAATRPIAPAATPRTDAFSFYVPQDAIPGSTIRIDATAVDTKGQLGTAAAVDIVVLDAVPPTITITGLATGARIRPGQQANAIVKAEDAGGIAAIAFKATGVTAFEQTRTIDPAQSAVFASFTFTIPANALPGETLNLDAVATDKAGNVTNAARVILPIADLSPPTVAIRTGHGPSTMSPGSPVTIIVDAADQSSVKRIDLTGDGAFPVADSKQIVPPTGSAQATFTINVPANTPDGAVLNLQARATDISDNTSDPIALALTAVTVTDVTLPPSIILLAGETVSVPVQLSSPAPAGGLRVDFSSRDANVASVTPSITIPEGESTGTLPVIGVAGGTVQIDASIKSVLRATLTATVRGGIVRGIVTDASHNPIEGAQVSLSDGFNVQVTTTNGAGEYFFEGYPLFGFSIKARHPEAGYGFATGQMSRQNGFAQLNVVLMGAGLIRGRVLQADGTATGPGVTVTITAQGAFSPLAAAITNDAGEYEFPFVTLGSYTIDAADGNGNRGRAPAALDTIGAELEVPVTYLGRGTVIATVRDGSDNAVPNAVVKFTNVTVFGYEPVVQISSDAQGVARFDNVLVGEFQIEARDPISGAAGYLYGRLLQHGEELARDVRIGSFAALTGTVYRVDGTTPVPFARVNAGGDFGVFTTADQFGKYRFDFLRLGTFRIDASEAATGGRGTATVTLSTNGQTVNRDITFVGQGSILATVKNAFGNPVPNAWVTVRTNHPEVGYEERNAVTGADGTVLFQRVLVGPFTILAYSGSLFGTTAGSLTNQEVRQVTVQLQNTGTIAGTIYAPDGQTLAQSGTVYVHHPLEITFYPSGIAQAALDASGIYRFENLPLGTYNLSVRDAQGRLRAVVRTVVLATLGQVETRDMTMIGLGTVRGQVLFDNATSTPASGVPVEVRSLTPTLGTVATTTTNAGGFYEVQNVVAGSFTVSAGLPDQQLLGEGGSAIAAHGQIVVVDVVLQNNALNLPVTKWDANNQYYQIQRDAALAGSGGDLFSRTFHGVKGGLVLELLSGAATDRFTGSAIGTQEEAKREIAVRQLSLAGVNVTRKVYVPQTGYFARYLDVLTNPTAAPVTLDVRVSSALPREGYALVTTSSGDVTLATGADPSADRWVVFDDADGTFTRTATAFVFDGPDAAQNASLVQVEDTTEPNCFFNSTCSSQRLAYTWTNVTIQPGESVAFVHFLVQQRRRASAIASAERLAQLPPEALAGLSLGERDQIRNFAVPADGSTLPPLPSVTGTVTGRLFEGDGVTTVPSAVQSVKFKSTSIYFDAEHLINTDATGRFTLTATFNEFGSNVIVPVEPFALNAQRHPLTAIAAPPIQVAFPDGSLTVEQDVAFTNAGLLRGVVRRHNGNVVTTGHLTAFGNGFFVSFVQIGTDGSYRIGGVPGGPVTVTATISHPQGSALTVTTILQAVAGQSITADILLPATGTVAGTVTTALGSAAPNVRVDVVSLPGSPAFFQRGMNTDSAGGFMLGDVPAGDYHVRATDPATGVATTATVRVSADQTTTQNLQLVGSGTVRVQALFAGGAPAAGAFITVRDTSGAFNRFATADAAGRATLQNVPTGALIVRVQNPSAFQAVSEVPASLPSHGATIDVTVTLPPVGSVQVQVSYTGGGGAAGAPVEIKHAGTGANFFQAAGNTDASGRLTIANVLGPSFTVRSRHPVDFGNSPEITGALTTEGQVVPVTVLVPPVGSVAVQVNSTEGTPLSGIRVDIQDAGDTFYQFGGTTDANGRVTITRVRAAFTVQAVDPVNPNFTRFATGRVDTEGQTVPVTIVLGARGTVQGRVVDPFGNPVSTVVVDVLSENPSVRISVLTAADGTYSAPNVPVGNFRAKVSDFTLRRAGWAYGSIAQHGEFPTADIVTDKVFLSARLSDANAFQYGVGPIGDLSGGTVLSPFFGSHSLRFGTGAFLSNFFAGDFAGLPELEGRQIVIGNTQPSGGFPYVQEGLRIARKVYVPPSGYFARYLEIFENVTDAPITRAIQVQASLAAGFNARIATTSTGDTTFDAADRWAIANDAVQATRPIAAIVVAGDGASVLLGQAGLTDSRTDQPFARWNNVTIPAGGRVMLMHFAVQQHSTAAAQASAERLVQLPPEALEGLSADERASIVNFAVPSDGVSALAPFATLSGRVLAGDGATPVPGATVLVESLSPIFTRETSAVADASGAFTLATLVPGAFQARAKHPVTGAFTTAVSGTIPAGETSAVQDFVFAGTGSVRGVVRFASGAAAFGARVRITGGPSPIDVTLDAGADGGYVFGALPPGQYSLFATTPTRSTAVTPLTISAGETAALDLRLLAIATLRVTTTDQATNALLPGIGVALYAGGSFRGSRTTDASAVATFTGLWEETWTLLANGNGISGQATVTIGPADDGQTIDVPIALSGPVTGNIVGTVLAADGSTPVITFVELIDPTRGRVASMYSGPSGFAFNNVTDNFYGLQIVVRSPVSATDIVERLVRLTTPGATVTENFTLPLSVIRGTVSFDDGTPVPYPDAFVTQTIGGVERAFYAVTSDEQGHYLVLGTAVGPFTLTAQDGGSGLTATVSGELAALDLPITVDASLPVSGTVFGQVRDATGNPVPGALVGLQNPALSFNRTARADDQGNYRFERVALGEITVQGCNDSWVCGSAIGAVTAAGQQVNIPIVLPAVGAIAGTVFSAPGGPPVSSAQVFIENIAYSGPLRTRFQVFVGADAIGRFESTQVPVGSIRVTANGSVDYTYAGVSETTLATGDSKTVDVVLGNAVRFGVFNLAGTDGFRYDVRCDGTLGPGGAVDGHLGNAYKFGYRAAIGTVGADCLLSGPLDQDGRQITVGPSAFSGLVLTRKIFSPAAGGFARYLEVLSNPTATARTVTLEVSSSLGGWGTPESLVVLVPPSTTGNTFAITDLSAECCDPVLGHVFGGPGAPVSPATTRFVAGDNDVSYAWTVTVPAGQTVALMHFAIQREGDGSAAARAQAEALAALTDADALTGLTAAERAQIVNFVIR